MKLGQTRTNNLVVQSWQKSMVEMLGEVHYFFNPRPTFWHDGCGPRGEGGQFCPLPLVSESFELNMIFDGFILRIFLTCSTLPQNLIIFKQLCVFAKRVTKFRRNLYFWTYLQKYVIPLTSPQKNRHSSLKSHCRSFFF